MYTSGLNPKINELYPAIQYPISRGTPSIYGLPFWDHAEKWSDGLSYLVSISQHINNCNIVFKFNVYYKN